MQHERITLTCQQCGSTYETFPSRAKRSRYCSRECKDASQGGSPVTLICQHCGKSYRRSPHRLEKSRFCSNPCRNKAQIEEITVPCSNCGALITDKPSRFRRYSNRVFCSHACSAHWRSRNPIARRFGSAIKPHQRAIYGTTCVICGWERCIEYAHIIPVSERGTIHPDNIIPMCPNHHVLFDRHELDEDEYETVLSAIIRAWDSPNAYRPLP
jgi:endogenous inhibitor of DNA gyrase (YacG/DUF329 family)